VYIEVVKVVGREGGGGEGGEEGKKREKMERDEKEKIRVEKGKWSNSVRIEWRRELGNSKLELKMK
jgi:hypothetical protein